MKAYKYVIIGGGLAAGRAADGIRKLDTEGSIGLVAGEDHPPYERPPLSKGYLTGKRGLDRVYLREDTYYAENQIEVVSGLRATQVDVGARSATLEDGSVLSYEKLLLATGARAWRLPVPGNELPGVFTLRTIGDADAIRGAAKPGKRALVIGGSFIGSEVAASLAQLGVGVTIVFPETRLLERVVPQKLSGFLHEKYEANGVRILTAAKSDRLEGSGRVERAVLDNGETLDVDLVMMGVGVRLNTKLAHGAGLDMDDGGAVIVDEMLRTSDSNIYAAGDIAAWPDPTFGKRQRVEHWNVARTQGLRAGRNMAGEGKPYRTLPYFFSDLFDFSFEVWGDLTVWGETVLRGDLEGGSFAFYYFDQGKMVGVLAVDRPDAERKPMQTLVKARPMLDDVAAKLRNEEVSIDTMVE